MKNFTTIGKATVYVTFDKKPRSIKVYRNGILYFFRELEGKYQSIKFNICHAGRYTTNVECKSIAIKPIEIEPLNFKLPKPQRNYFQPFRILKNNSLKSTPARHYYKIGVIEIGPVFFKFPHCIRLFILLHEVGHFYYKDEHLADAYAAKKFIENGYNNSSAMYALTRILTDCTQKNEKRILSLFKILNK